MTQAKIPIGQGLFLKSLFKCTKPNIFAFKEENLNLYA